VGVVLGIAGLAGYGTAALADRLRGGSRRFTGSRFLDSGGVPPPTTFFGEPTPPLDPAAWRLTVSGRVGQPLELDLPALVALGVEDAVAVLDCTSGWAVETTWRGVPLRRVLEAARPAGAARQRVTVRSVTGWSTTLDGAEVRDALLATGVADMPLPAANGAPLRLVVPARRGLDWVKWVSEVSVG
jgi:DMSO/TMAO reductase YedYZ molybdopterin-dependent catalytic subunit